ncbi:MAG: hypothetical protein HWN65_15895 [Candidatus Helarchaeota archaeon]|nr:hypothetical protein [Candidatus Helarchaeota archaeon]
MESDCVLCEEEDPDLNLQSIPSFLPSYLPEKGSVHLNCLKYEVNNRISPIKYRRIPIILAIGFFSGLFLIDFSLWWFIFPIVISYLIILFVWVFKALNPNRSLMRWILEKQKIKEREMKLEDNPKELCVSCRGNKPDSWNYIKEKGKIRVNLLSIPCLLPKNLPEKGYIHLSCLSDAIYEHDNYLNVWLFMLWIFMLIPGGLTGLMLSNFGIIVITLLVMFSTWLPWYLLTRTYRLQKWTNEQLYEEGDIIAAYQLFGKWRYIRKKTKHKK